MSEKIGQLKMLAKDGKMRLTDVADTKTLLRIIQTIPSPKAEPFKRWLAQVGSERLDEIVNPELAINRAKETYIRIWKLAFPTILIIIGLSIIFKDNLGGKVSSEIKKLNEKRNGENSYCATFSGQNVNFDGEKFTGADLTAIFGGVKCDLRKAIIESDVVINASSTFGGIDIYVPSNVKIKTKSTSIFGGVENKANTTEDENSHTIYINGTALFGGVEVK